jgi:hypothetical protein
MVRDSSMDFTTGTKRTIKKRIHHRGTENTEKYRETIYREKIINECMRALKVKKGGFIPYIWKFF